MKKLEISKELLGEVLNLEVLGHSLLNKQTNSINVQYMPDEDSLTPDWKPIDIYELAYNCKAWANSKGHSYIGNNKLINIYSQDNQIIALVNKNIVNWYDVDFIACQWILDNKEGI